MITTFSGTIFILFLILSKQTLVTSKPSSYTGVDQGKGMTQRSFSNLVICFVLCLYLHDLFATILIFQTFRGAIAHFVAKMFLQPIFVVLQDLDPGSPGPQSSLWSGSRVATMNAPSSSLINSAPVPGS